MMGTSRKFVSRRSEQRGTEFAIGIRELPFEVVMSGRRSYPRFDVSPSSEGVLRILRDVTVQRAHENELLVIGREAGVVGDELTLEIAQPLTALSATVRVVESLPILINGAVRHRLRLRREGAGQSSGGHSLEVGPVTRERR